MAGLGTVADVEAAVALANRYLDALGEEIDGRETHHKRFFQAGEHIVSWIVFRGGGTGAWGAGTQSWRIG